MSDDGVWIALPTCNLSRARTTADAWKAQGYRVAAITEQMPCFGASLHVWREGYVGYWRSCNVLARAIAAIENHSSREVIVFAADDLMAASAIEVCLQSAVRVPEDLSVVGFNDTVLAQYLHLTTVHLSALERGQLAIQRLFARIENPYLPVEGITVPTRLVIRQSCGARLASTPP